MTIEFNGIENNSKIKIRVEQKPNEHKPNSGVAV